MNAHNFSQTQRFDCVTVTHFDREKIYFTADILDDPLADLLIAENNRLGVKNSGIYGVSVPLSIFTGAFLKEFLYADGLDITVIAYDKEGYSEECTFNYYDFLGYVLNHEREPYFRPDQIPEFKSEITETISRVIECKYNNPLSII